MRFRLVDKRPKFVIKKEKKITMTMSSYVIDWRSPIKVHRSLVEAFSEGGALRKLSRIYQHEGGLDVQLIRKARA